MVDLPLGRPPIDPDRPRSTASDDWVGFYDDGHGPALRPARRVEVAEADRDVLPVAAARRRGDRLRAGQPRPAVRSAAAADRRGSTAHAGPGPGDRPAARPGRPALALEGDRTEQGLPPLAGLPSGRSRRPGTPWRSVPTTPTPSSSRASPTATSTSTRPGCWPRPATPTCWPAAIIAPMRVRMQQRMTALNCVPPDGPAAAALARGPALPPRGAPGAGRTSTRPSAISTSPATSSRRRWNSSTSRPPPRRCSRSSPRSASSTRRSRSR